MADPTTAPGDPDLHLTCRRLLFREGRPEEDEPRAVCADLCRTPVGAISLLDCPVWHGLRCRFYERREGDPEPLVEAELLEHRESLRSDYMRWRYWRRVRDLRSPAGSGGPPDVDGLEPSRPLHEIPARPEAALERRKPRFPGDAPSGPPPRPPSEVDLDHLPDLTPAEDEPGPDDAAPATDEAPPEGDGNGPAPDGEGPEPDATAPDAGEGEDGPRE